MTVTRATSQVKVSMSVLGTIHVIQLLEVELDELERVTTSGQQALGFFQFVLGAFLSAVISWVSLNDPTTVQIAVYAPTTAVLALFSVWFGLKWRSESKQRAGIFERVRRRIQANE
jgi:hypothetical protein